MTKIRAQYKKYMKITGSQWKIMHLYVYPGYYELVVSHTQGNIVSSVITYKQREGVKMRLLSNYIVPTNSLNTNSVV